jgi:hypothetical protein
MRLSLKFGALLMLPLFATGCFLSHSRTPSRQNVTVEVRQQDSQVTLAGAVVSAMFPAPSGINSFIRQQLEDGPKAGINTATSRYDGVAEIPVQITGPASGPGPDQVTNGPIAFRIQKGAQVECFLSPSVKVGDVLAGRWFAIQIIRIDQPERRH